MQSPTTMTDDEISHRLSVIGAQFRVASPHRRTVLVQVVDALLDEQQARHHAPT